MSSTKGLVYRRERASYTGPGHLREMERRIFGKSDYQNPSLSLYLFIYLSIYLSISWFLFLAMLCAEVVHLHKTVSQNARNGDAAVWENERRRAQ